MASPSEFRIAIVGMGPLRKVTLCTVDIADFTAAVKGEFGLAPHELNRLELRRVDGEPNDENAEELFNAPTPTGSSRKINKTELLNAGVQYIVGKIAEQPSE